MKQTQFSFAREFKKEFGGELLIGKRKSMRPLSIKDPMHLTLKSEGRSYFHPGRREFDLLIRSQAKRFGVKIYRSSLNWSHLHLILKIPSRKAYNAFIRVLTAKLTQLISSIYKIDLKSLLTLRPWTRILSWGREFKSLCGYLVKNDLQAWGMRTTTKSKVSGGKAKIRRPKEDAA